MQEMRDVAAKTADTLTQIISKRLADNRLILPAMPSLAVQCHALIARADYSVRDLTETIGLDAVLAARVVSVASSPMYGAGLVPSLATAVTRLGAARLREVVVEWSAEKLFTSPDRQTMAYLKGLWVHSVAVGMVARNLVTLCAEPDLIDSAYLCGLLHDIGKAVLASVLLVAEDQMSSQPGRRWMLSHQDWLDVVVERHRGVGVAVARAWGLPDELATAIADAAEFDPANRRGLPNFVRLANAIVKLEGIIPGPVNRQDCETMLMIGRSMLGVDDAIIERVRSQIKADLQNIESRL